MTNREKAEPYLSHDSDDPTFTRMIDSRDGSVWSAFDNGYRHKAKSAPM